MNPICAVAVAHPPLIIPAVGRGQEKAIQKTTAAYKAAAGLVAACEPETVIVLSPHAACYADYFHISPGKTARGDFSRFGASDEALEAVYDDELAASLSAAARKAGLPAGTLGAREKELDHGTAVPLFFLKEAYGGKIKPKIVRIGLSGLPYAEHYRLGMLITETADAQNKKIAVVSSGDLSHKLKEDGPYGFCMDGPLYDQMVMRVLESGDFGELLEFDEDFCERAAQCGHRSFVIMAGCFDGLHVKAQKLSYEGPFGVGYGVCTFVPEGRGEGRNFLENYRNKRRVELDKRRKNEDEYVRLARNALEVYVKTGKTISVPDGLPGEITKRRAGAFVSLHKNGRLRGCMGTITASAASVAEEIINNAVCACSRDPRFDPVRPDELNEISYSVDVLGETQEVSSADSLDVKRYGVIVTSGAKRGLLLPNLDGVTTVAEQLEIAKRKAGIRDGEKVSLERFEVVRHF